MSPAAPRCAFLVCACALFLLQGCASRTSAPVVERGAGPSRQAASAPAPAAGGLHTVKKGETLYSIALDHGHSPRDVAAWNNLDNPNSIKVGQQLRVAPPEGGAVARPVMSPGVVEVRPAATSTDAYKREPKGGKQPYSEQALAAAQKSEEPQAAAARPEPRPADAAAGKGAELSWGWPGNGKIITAFAEGGNKGIDLAGRIGDPVLAAEAGKVSYANNGIRGYGNLLIVQHPGGMTSVYAHNSKLLAKEGQMVAKGQKIAEVGNSDTDQAKIHFEIRHQGKPLDPLKYLPAH